MDEAEALDFSADNALNCLDCVKGVYLFLGYFAILVDRNGDV